MCIHEDGIGFLTAGERDDYRDVRESDEKLKAWAEARAQAGDGYYVGVLARQHKDWWTPEQAVFWQKRGDEVAVAEAEAYQEAGRRRAAERLARLTEALSGEAVQNE